MTLDRKEILTEALVKAYSKGFADWGDVISNEYPFEITDTEIIITVGRKDGDKRKEVWSIKELLFSSEFAKFFWPNYQACSFCGKRMTCSCSIRTALSTSFDEGKVDVRSTYEPITNYHLKQMVVMDDPVYYLADFI